MEKTRLNVSILTAGLLLAGTAGLAVAEGDKQAVKPLALQKIMKDLGKNMQVITDAISRENWPLIETTAPLIANHPQPPMSEKMRLIGFVGTDMDKFKSHDKKTSMAARALGHAAKDKDGVAVITAFQKLQITCYECHREFRQPFVEYFYGAGKLAWQQ